MARYSKWDLQKVADAAAKRSVDPSRHKVFISHHAANRDEVAAFLDSFGHVMIPRTIGVSDDDDFIDSFNTDYVMDKIREKYLTNSTVTIVMIGGCTWARKYVDWEVFSTLRNDRLNRRSGLLAITLPSMSNNSNRRLPPRVDDNVRDNQLYARWWKYPSNADQVRRYVEEAFQARSNRAHLIDNSRVRKVNNSPC
jgi:hypothetical protein